MNLSQGRRELGTQAWVLVALLALSAWQCSPVTPPAPCVDYCQFIQETCTGEFQQYASEAACVTYCTDLAQLPTGVENEETNNTIQCRITHTEYAEVSPPSTLAAHCDHSGPNGDNLCGSWCDVYCDLATLNCPQLFDGERAFCAQECAQKIAAVPDTGKPGDVGGNTIQCRINHLGLAGGEAAARNGHCDAAKFVNSTQCVTPGLSAN